MDPKRLSIGSADERDSLGQAFAEAQPKEPVGLESAQASVAAALFGTQEPDAQQRGGRFHKRYRRLNRLGAGGMGVIYEAKDLELERRVALKSVHVPGTSGSDALAEAKALAAVNSPNVVTIYDYDFRDERLYIVMELINGSTLRRWAKGRTEREILEAYRQAGEGLAAAHAKGLVHRDFKPDNAIMGTDGRVRVVDFGLACEVTDPTGRAQATPRFAGTPGYMAPEQVSGGAITAATDQYGFCTALRNALQEQERQVGIPRWLRAVIERGRAPNPADRFPSMQALLHSLSSDPAAVKRRSLDAPALELTLAGGVLLAFVGLTIAVGNSVLSGREKLCDGGEERLAEVWGIEGRETALDRIAKMSEYGNSLRARLEGALVEHSRMWTAGYREACLAGTRSLQSAALVDRRMACLDRGRAALKSVAEVASTATADNVSDLVLAVRALPDSEACGDLTALLADTDPPPAGTASRVEELRGRLAEARIQIAAGRSTQVQVSMEDTVAAARAISYKPLLSEALLVQGHALMNAGERIAATRPLKEAYTTAFESGLLSLAVEAWARWAWARGTSLGGDDSLSGVGVVEAVASNPSTARFSRALLYNNIGGVELALENRGRAQAAFERASREARGVRAPEAIELLNVNVNLGLITDDPIRRDQILAAAASEKARLLGEDHPETLEARWYRGKEAVRLEQTLEILEPTCAAMQAQDNYRAARCWLEVGYIRREGGDEGGAVDALQRAASIKTGFDSQLPLIQPYLLLWQGDGAAATRAFTSALEEHVTLATQFARKLVTLVEKDALVEIAVGSRAIPDSASARRQGVGEWESGMRAAANGQRGTMR